MPPSSPPPPITNLPTEVCDLIIDRLPLQKDRVNAWVAFNLTFKEHRVSCSTFNFKKAIQELRSTILNSAPLSRLLADTMGIDLTRLEKKMRPTPASAFAHLNRFMYNRLHREVNSIDPQWMVQGQPFSAQFVADEKIADISRLREWLLFGNPFANQVEKPKERVRREKGYKLFLSEIASDSKYGGAVCQECLVLTANNLQQAQGTNFCPEHRVVFCEEYRVDVRDFADIHIVLQDKMGPLNTAQYWMDRPLGHMSPTMQRVQGTISREDADILSSCLANMSWQNLQIQARDNNWTHVETRPLTTKYWICSETIFRLQHWASETIPPRDKKWDPRTIGGCIPRLDFDLRKLLVRAPKTKAGYVLLHKFMQQAYAAHISDFPKVEDRAPNEVQEDALINALAGHYLNQRLLQYHRISDLKLFGDYDIRVYRQYEPQAFRPQNRPAPPALVCQPPLSTKLDAFTCTNREAEQLASNIHGCMLRQVTQLPEHTRRLNCGIHSTKIAVMEHIRSSFPVDTLEIYMSLHSLINGKSSTAASITPLPAVPGVPYVPTMSIALAIHVALRSIDHYLRQQTQPRLSAILQDIRDISEVPYWLVKQIVDECLPGSSLLLAGVTEEAFKEWKKDKDVFIIADPTSRAVGAMSPLQQRVGQYKCQPPAHPIMPWAIRQLELTRTDFFAGYDAQDPGLPLVPCQGRKALSAPTQQSEAVAAAITKHTFWVEDFVAGAFISNLILSKGGLQPKALGRVIWFEHKEAWA